MANLILDERDQKFVLYEMLQAEKLCEHPRYADFSRETFDMILDEAQKFAVEEIFPTLKDGDREGCRLEKGQVYVPKSFHRVYKLFREAGWNSMGFPQEIGGQGLPRIMRLAANDWFIHNFAFIAYPGLTAGAAHLVEVYATALQKEKYLHKMVAGEWAGTMCLTEPGAGTDVGNISTKAIRQPDGTFRIQGTKIFITSGDHDLTENIIHPVLARIEGDPPGTGGISIFLVPKYIVNDDGSLGARNDYEIAGIEEKMGIHGSSTCLINFGDNGACYGELLGEEREGIKIMFKMMNEARIGVGMQGLTSATIAYLHALQYSKERLQGASLLDFANPAAPRVALIHHPDIRRTLLWMKSHVDGMRALMYFASYCGDMILTAKDQEAEDKWSGILEVLTPICKAYCSDVGFLVINNAMQIYGGYGYCQEYPIEQFMRDEKIACIFEGANGIQALDLIGRKLGMRKGACFMALYSEMQSIITRYQELLPELAPDVQAGLSTMAEMATFFAKCAKAGKFMIPVGNAYPYLLLMGRVICACFLFWEAGIAREKLNALTAQKGVDPNDATQWSEFIKSDKDAAFYAGKLAGAKYFIKNELPYIEAIVKAIKSEDMSIMDIAEESFAG